MRKKTLTAEQIAARDAKRARFQAIAKQIADMSDEQRAQLAASCSPRTVEGHALSLVNSILVAMQKPDATVVAGFRQWLRHGRAVRKGESGLTIWAPCGTKREADAPPADESGESGEGVRFLSVTVFDVTQTEIAA